MKIKPSHGDKQFKHKPIIIKSIFDESAMRVPKVCIITSVHPPFDTRIFHREAKSLANNGIDVTFIVPWKLINITIDKINIVGLTQNKLRIQRLLKSLKVLNSALCQTADIYHFHDPELIPLGILLQLITKKPVVYDIHEHYPDAIKLKDWIPGWIRKFAAIFFDSLEICFASFFAALITADDAIASRFHNCHDRLVILYNFPKADFGQMQKGIKPHRQHAVQLIYVGGINRDRGQWLMLDVVRILASEKNKDVGLWVIGNLASDEKRCEFVKAIESDEVLRNRVVCPGIIPQEDLGPWLASADVGLVPLQPVAKFYKNIPTKMFEYMAVGLPVVGSDLPPIRRFIEESKAGLLAVPADPHSHAEKIFSIIEHPEMAKQMGLHGRKAFLTKFNWASEEKKLLSLYRKLLNLPHDRNASIKDPITNLSP
jgi:glycosyltransferase involved in cell wall biosynthesis